MKDLTQVDLDYARNIVDDIVDNIDILNIKIKLEVILTNYFGNMLFTENRKRQFLVFLNGCFGSVILNELTWRCNEAYDRAHEARLVTKQLNNR